MTTSNTTPTSPLFHVRGGRRSTAHAMALISLCLALGAGFVSQVWSGPSSAQAVATSASQS
jgi:hypothetical protein